jgi:hypothetical protein
MDPYLNHDDFNRYFEYLQLIGMMVEFPDSPPCWTYHTARVSHIDAYGITINKGESYYKRTFRNKEFKLSHQSMDQYLYLLFEETPALQHRCESLLEEQKEKIAKGKNLRDW